MEITANKTNSYLILPYDSVKSLSCSGKKYSKNEKKAGNFHLKKNSKALIINCINLHGEGELKIELNDTSDEIEGCFYNDGTPEFTIPAGVTEVTLALLNRKLSIRYEEPESEFSVSSFFNTKFEPKVKEKEKEPLIQPKPKPDPPSPEIRPEKKSSDQLNSIQRLEQAFNDVFDEVKRNNSERSEPEQLELICGALKAVVKPYTEKEDNADLAEILLNIAKEIIDQMVNKTQEKTDNETLPKG